jgi:hypothetical protein
MTRYLKEKYKDRKTEREWVSEWEREIDT